MFPIAGSSSKPNFGGYRQKIPTSTKGPGNCQCFCEASNDIGGSSYFKPDYYDTEDDDYTGKN